MDDIASVKVQLGNYLQKWERNVATWWTLYQGHTPMILRHIYNTAIRVSKELDLNEYLAISKTDYSKCMKQQRKT